MPKQRLPQVSKLVESAVNKLVDASKVIEHRMGLKQTEEKRVNDAFRLLVTRLPLPNSRGAKQQDIYLDFLRRVQQLLGSPRIVLCAVGLGLAAVANTRDRVQVDLPFKLKEQEKAFRNSVLQSIADSYTTKCEFALVSSE